MTKKKEEALDYEKAVQIMAKDMVNMSLMVLDILADSTIKMERYKDAHLLFTMANRTIELYTTKKKETKKEDND